MGKPQDQATFRGRETTFEALGRMWRVSRMDVDVMDDFCAWAGTVLPDPLDKAADQVERLASREYAVTNDKTLTEEERQRQLFFLRQHQDRLTRIAMERASSYLALNSPEVVSVRRHPRGGAQLLHLLLRKHQPDVTIDECLRIMLEIDAEEFIRVMSVAMGKAPPAPPDTGASPELPGLTPAGERKKVPAPSLVTQ